MNCLCSFTITVTKIFMLKEELLTPKEVGSEVLKMKIEAVSTHRLRFI